MSKFSDFVASQGMEHPAPENVDMGEGAPTPDMASFILEARKAGINPFSAMVPRYARTASRPSFGGAFASGVKTGFMHPISGIIELDDEEGEKPEGWSMGHSIAEMAGTFAGAGVSFLPFLKGTQIALKGMGFASRTVGFRLMEGAISGAAFELGSDTAERIEDRVLIGASFGVGAEVALMGIAKAWRARFPKATERTPITDPSRLLAAPARVEVDAAAIAMERNLHPAGGKSFEEAVERMSFIQREGEALEVAAARVAQAHRPRGEVLLVGIREPGRSIRALKKALPEGTNITLGAGDEPGVYTVLVRDPGPRTGIYALKQQYEKFVKTYMGQGKPPTWDEAVAFLKEPLAWEPPVTVKNPGSNAPFRGAYFPAKPGEIQVKVRGPGEEEQLHQLSTLVHEYVHNFHGMLSGLRNRQTGAAIPPPAVPLEDMFQSIDKWFANADGTLLHPTATAQVRQEMKEASLQIINIKDGYGGDWNAVKKAYEKGIWGDKKYYKHDTEALARLTELMFLDPAKAKQVAPLATKLWSTKILEESPKLEMLLTKTELKNLNKVLKGYWLREGDQTQFYRELAEEFTPAKGRQFQETGFYQGMEVWVDGKPMLVTKVPPPPRGLLRRERLVEVVDPKSGQTQKVLARKIHRPMMPQMVTRNEGIIRKVTELVKKPPKWVGVVMRQRVIDPVATAKKGSQVTVAGVRRAIVKLDNFEQTDGMASFWDNADNIRIRDELAAKNPEDFKKINSNQMLRAVLEAKGKDGLVINDGGRHILFIADETKAMQFSSEVGSPAWARATDGDLALQTDPTDKLFVLESPWIEVSQVNVMESLLREAGVDSRELDFFLNINPFQKAAEEVAQGEGLLSRILAGSKKVADSGQEPPLEASATTAGVKVDVTTNGEVRVLSETNEELARFGTADEASDYIATLGPDQSKGALDAASPIGTDALPTAPGGSVRPIKPFEQPRAFQQDNFSTRLLDSLQLFLSPLTAMENFAKSVERRGFGPAYTRVFEPIQQALREVDKQLYEIKHATLNGRTFREQLEIVENLIGGRGFGKGLAREKQTQIVQAIEATSREEIEKAGGLMARAMSENEIALGKTIVELGLGDDIPRLTATLRAVKSLQGSKAQFLQRYAARQRVQLDPAVKEMYDRLFQMAEEVPDDIQKIFDMLGLSQKERMVMGMIDNVLSKDLDDMSLYAISRWAAAKPLGKGFKSGRDEFMALHRFDGRDKKIVEELDRLYKAAFQISNLESKREITGYWPHMRKWIENGFSPEEEFIRRHVPESVEWSAQRVNTGELNVYLMDPILTSYKYIRAMLMKQHFDPILPNVKEAMQLLDAGDPRAASVLREYIHEAMGKPHVSFRKLHDVISTSTRILTGKEPDENFTRTIVNTMGALANAAAIPFRPMLILRNYFQMLQMIPPRTGVEAYFQGMKIALSEEGFKNAVEKGIVTKNILPVHASTEIFGTEVSNLTRRLQHIFRKGFEWYQKPDDIGRAASFYAARSRINAHVDDLMTGKIDYATFKQRAKINTYDSLDVQQFDELWAAGRYEEAKDWIGSRLAREAIFRYGHVNHPSGWGSVAGRLYGTFGTWPTQYKDFLLQGMLRGSTKDRLEFLAIHGAVNAATLGAGAAIGLDLMSWVAFPSLNYTGGPFADLTINTVQAFGGSPAEQSMAKRNIRLMFPSLEDPRSIFIPGSYFVSDLWQAAQADDSDEMVQEALGLRLLSSDSSNPFAGMF